MVQEDFGLGLSGSSPPLMLTTGETSRERSIGRHRVEGLGREP